MDEIKRLQEEFARAQMSGSMARLSERNCVEVIMMLQKFGLIELLYTMDGKQYLTPAQLQTDIRNEIAYRGGRVNVVELHEVVNVDLTVVQNSISAMLKSDGQLTLVQGDLIDRSYIEGLAVEANDMLQEAGYLSISELCNTFDLPFDFLLEKLEPMVGNVLKGQMDRSDNGAIYTDAFVARQTARLLGVFSAITRPTPLSSLLMRFPFHQQLFRTELDRLIADGQLPGKLQGRGEKAEYVPNIQQKTQDRWIEAFYRGNQYVEYDAVERLGIRKPKSRLKSMFPDGCSLETCIVGPVIVENVNESIELALKDGLYVDIMTLLPSPCMAQDAEALISKSTAFKKSGASRILCDSVVCSEGFVTSCGEVFKDLMSNKAKEVAVATAAQGVAARAPVESGNSAVPESDAPTSKRDKRKDKKKKGADTDKVSSGGGSKSGASSVSGEQQWVFMSLDEVEAVLKEKVEGCSPEMHTELAGVLHRQLSARFQEYVREAFRGGVTAADRRETSASLANEYTNTYLHSRLCQAGIEQLEGDVVAGLVKYLLKDLGAKLLNILVKVQAQESYVNCPTGEMTTAQRKAVVAEIPSDSREPLLRLEGLLNEKTVDAFLNPLEDIAENFGFRVKRSDKKRDKRLAFEHRARLQEQLSGLTEPSAVLLLVTVLKFQAETGCVLHAQGRSVSAIIAYLEKTKAWQETDLACVLEYQRKVMAKLTSKDALAEEDVISDGETTALKALVARPTPKE